MHFAKLGFAALLLLSACDKSEDKMQATGSMTSASAMTPSMAPTGTMAPSAMAASMAPTGAMGAAAAPAGSAPMMNDKMAPKMGASANHM